MSSASSYRLATQVALTVLVTLASAGAVALHAQTSPDSATSVLEGTVRGRFGGKDDVLAHAVVEVRGTGFGMAAITDSLGRYRFGALPSGPVRVRATRAGHATLTLTVELPPNGSVRVDLELRATPLRLPAIDVVGDATGRDAPSVEDGGPPDPALTEVEMQALDATPGVGQPGLLAAVRALPGNDPADASDVLFMRGSTTDLKLVLLDGVPVYTPFHVAGLMRSFEPTVLGRADLHVGGAPARYDGGLTHILDLGTRRARRDRLRASGSVDLLSASLAAEVPLGQRIGMVASARSLHDLGTAPLGGGERPYGYRDLLVALDGDPASGHAVRATGFWNAESVRLDFERGTGDAAWSNRAGSVGYHALLGGTALDVTAGVSAYDADLPLQPSGEPGEPLPLPLLASARIERARVVAEARFGSAAAPIRTGISFDHIDAAYSARGDTSHVASRAITGTPGAFVDATVPVGPGVTIRAGMRGDLFGGREARVAPRAALYWEVGPEALLTLAAGRYHQPTRSPDFEVERTLAAVAEDGVQGTALLPVATADHVVLSLDQRLGGQVALGLEGFWKRYEGLQTGRETIRNSGIDLRVVSSGEAGVAWLGYGLSWFWSTLDLSGHASDFGGRHLVSAGLSGRLAGPLRGEAKVAYGAGIPYTSVPFSAPGRNDLAVSEGPGTETLGDGRVTGNPTLVTGLDEEFLRIDVEFHALFEPTWGGHRWQVRPYLRLLNALDRRDALFYTFQRWRSDDVRPLAERPFLPLVGVAFRF